MKNYYTEILGLWCAISLIMLGIIYKLNLSITIFNIFFFLGVFTIIIYGYIMNGRVNNENTIRT